jgi:hypothetical protein
MKNIKTKTYKIIPEVSGLIEQPVKSSTDMVNFARQFYHEDLVIYESFFICL